MPDVVIVIPSQGADLNGFLGSAKALAERAYPGRAVIIRTTMSFSATGYSVGFATLDGKAFSFRDQKGLKRVLTISHSFSGDGPNMNYGSGGNNQPWGTVDELGAQLTPYAKTFWAEVGAAMTKDGQFILLGCFMGGGDYGKLVAHASGKPVYASASLFAAGNAETSISYVKRIEAGQTPAPMKKFGPPIPATASPP